MGAKSAPVQRGEAALRRERWVCDACGGERNLVLVLALALA